MFTRKNELAEILVAVNFGKQEKYIRFEGKLKNALTNEVSDSEIILKNGEYGAFYAV